MRPYGPRGPLSQEFGKGHCASLAATAPTHCLATSRIAAVRPARATVTGLWQRTLQKRCLATDRMRPHCGRTARAGHCHRTLAKDTAKRCLATDRMRPYGPRGPLSQDSGKGHCKTLPSNRPHEVALRLYGHCHRTLAKDTAPRWPQRRRRIAHWCGLYKRCIFSLTSSYKTVFNCLSGKCEDFASRDSEANLCCE